MSRRRPDDLPARVSVAIAGAGIAGCAAALALQAAGLTDVVVLDRDRAPAFRLGETIPAFAVGLLKRLGAYGRAATLRPLESSGSTSLWGKDTPGHNDALGDPDGAGWHLDRAAFDAALREEVRARGIALVAGHLTEVRRAEAGGFRLAFARGPAAGAIEADVLLDASGAGATALRRLGIARNPVDELTVRHAVLAVEATGATAARTFLEAVPYGWWYATRIPGDRMVAMVATDPAAAAEAGLSLRSTDGFRRALEATHLVGPAVAAARPAGILSAGGSSASSAILSGIAGPDWLAAGDAGWSCDPLTAQGITKALMEGIAAAAAITDRQRGNAGAFAAYQAIAFARFTANLRLRAALYTAETRWPDKPFWRARRLEGPVPAAEDEPARRLPPLFS
ncbi:Dehydrogenase (flavoprotein) [Pseudoxanthobacter soli DSM 19599]|uniref:Dehydrogenase (Flavoprotein) n=1 Tax=Pseudoxanthobacter soli DSM 19599 TaxID=1123029 RepID=A0A1M7ZP32_9HYPH|nr:tryptophan 7-halogenase [Pseudoxanthobacter soli]SHO66621.1 Dehydrogenase (flavoprotein) [Pseudoxanthobacter soli DSM 19599]